MFYFKVKPYIKIKGEKHLNSGDKLILTCECRLGCVKITWLEWKHDDVTVNLSDSRVNVTLNATATTLYIKDLKTSDKGNYTCQAQALGNISTETFVLKVRSKSH